MMQPQKKDEVGDIQLVSFFIWPNLCQRSAGMIVENSWIKEIFNAILTPRACIYGYSCQSGYKLEEKACSVRQEKGCVRSKNFKHLKNNKH